MRNNGAMDRELTSGRTATGRSVDVFGPLNTCHPERQY